MQVEHEEAVENEEILDQNEHQDEDQEELDENEQEQGQGDESESEGEEKADGEDEQEEKPEESRDSQWVNDLRKRYRESERARKKAEAELAKLNPQKEPELGKKPELAQFDFDTDKYEAALDEWYKEKQKVDAVKAEKAAAEEKAKQEWEAKLAAFNDSKKELNLEEYAEREEEVSDMLSVAQQSIIVKYAASPAKLIHRLGGNYDELLQMSKITDPIEFAIAVTKMENTEMKTAPGKKKPPTPERVPKGGSGAAVSGDNVLERLRAEADKTGDYTKVNEYRRKMREQKN